ncbi:MAG: response regulator [Bacteroidota bacterium]|jgi:signal transduction histidine kinase/DNA-binding response OmpR family regulator
MFSSKLFWKVTFYFALLLIILSATTVVTLYFLTQIQKSYSQASVDMTTTSNLDRLKGLIVDIQSFADEYMYTNLPEKRTAYDVCWKEFDNEIVTLQKSYTDSTDMQTLKQIRSSCYAWVTNIGAKKILLASSGLKSDELGKEIYSLGRQQSSNRYLETAQTLIRTLYQQRLTSVPKNIEYSIGLSKNIASFIVLVNVLLAVFAIALGFILTRSITKPVEQLRGGTQNIMQGIYEPIALHQRDEFGDLANDFNQMSKMLEYNYSRLTAYSELMTALNKHESLATVEQASLQILCSHTDASVGALYLLEIDSKMLKLVSGYALQNIGNRMVYKIGEGIPGQCAAMKQTIEVNNLIAAKDFIIDTGLVSIVPKYVLATPILFQENLIGVIVLGSMKSFDEHRREIMDNSVPQIGVAITNAMNLESTKKLSSEITTKNNELNSKNTELQKAYRVKSDFLSNMSHELRTPLNSIIGFTSVLLGQHGDPLTADQAKALEKVLKNGKHLLDLINDILDFSKIEAGRTPINLSTDEIANVISSALVTVEPMVVGKDVKLVQEVEQDLPLLNTDTLKIKQILLNLLSNAAKFTEQGAITVIAKKQKDMISISVKDDGIGIEAKNLDRVFEEFQQIDSSNARKYKGTGLGLAIAKNYARILGGNLTVHSEVGKGSTFTLVIPPVIPDEKLLKPTDETSAVKNAVVSSGSQSVSERSHALSTGVLILCIDDDTEVIDLLRRYLIPEGYSVRGVTSGEEGVRLAQELHPAVITLDVMMPEKDGWQVLRELKNNPTTSDIPVIIHSVVENRPLALSLGALEVVTKPSEPKVILSIVERACRSNNQPIMIVDDNHDFADSLKILLEAEGYRAIALYSGEDALKDIETINPSLLFLDLIMPGIDGFAVVQQLRSLERWHNLPIVILSGADITFEQRQNLNKLIEEFIEKGHFSKELITSTIKKIISPSYR